MPAMTERTDPGPFSRVDRIRSQREFRMVFRHGRRGFAGPIRAHVIPRASQPCRLGLSVSRKVGGAVARNTIKRHLRNAFRLCRHEWKEHIDVVLVVQHHPRSEADAYIRWLDQAVRNAMGWTDSDQ